MQEPSLTFSGTPFSTGAPIDFWPPSDTAVPIFLLAVTIVWLLFHFLLDARRFAAWLAEDKPPTEAQKIRGMEVQRIAGGALLGIVPLLAAMAILGPNQWAYGWYLTADTTALIALVIPAIIILPTVALATRRSNFTQHYPELRIDSWTGELAARNVGWWGIYLLGYEAFFRGVLLFGLIPFVGVWLAIAIQGLLYVAVHLHKNAGECIGSLVMSVVFALVALAAHSFLAAFLLHWMIASTAETLAIRRLRAGVESEKASAKQQPAAEGSA